jgi:hypothetical protein
LVDKHPIRIVKAKRINIMPQLNTESPTYIKDTITRISLALGYDGESNQQCWDWMYAVSDRYGWDGIDERMDVFLKYHENTGYLACSKNFRKK